MTVGTESHSTGHSSRINTTTVAAVKDSTGNTRELYILLDIGLVAVYLVIIILIMLKILRNLSPTIVLQVAPTKPVDTKSRWSFLLNHLKRKNISY